MTAGVRWRVAGAVVVCAAALLPLGSAHWAGVRAERAFAEGMTRTVASYLALATPPARGSADYNLGLLLIRARSLVTLPGWTPEVEVYHGTAPLVSPMELPLPAAEFDALRRVETIRWRHGAALAPLKDRDDWDVVGAVALRPAPGEIAPRWVGAWVLAAFALAVWLGVGAARLPQTDAAVWRQAFRRYAAGAVALGVITGGAARGAARTATDRSLDDTRLLLQEAGRIPGVTTADLRRLVPGAELTQSDSGDVAPYRLTVDGIPRAAIRVRLAGWRWLELRTLPHEQLATGWVLLCVGLSLLGPAALWLVAWAERASARPQRLRETVTAWSFLAPATAHLAVFSFGPILFALYLSVHRWSPIEPVKPFVGLANFRAVLTDPLVWISLRNTVLYALYVPVTMALALAVALVLRRSTRVARLLRTAFFLPTVSSVVAIALVWQWMYNADFGLINWLLRLAGMKPVDWLGNPRTALLAVMLMSVWVQLGYQMVVFLAGLQGIPQQYLDAARVDGAGAWRRFWRITFPLLRPVTLFVLVTGIIGSFQVFTYIYVLTDGGPLHATDVVVYRIYQSAWEFLRFGDASALAVILFVVLFGVTWAQFRLLGRQVDYA
jgi:ABC-type sugar transport system permease subunit